MQREKAPLFIFGVNPVLEKLRASPSQVLELLVVEGTQRGALRSIEEEARHRGLSIHYVRPELLDRLTEGGRHQGVVAKVGSYPYHTLGDLLQDLPSSSERAWILLLDGLTDPRNFGALLRSAEGVGIRHVVIPKDRSAGVTPVVVKTSAGAVHYLKIYRVANLRHALLTLKQKGYWAVGLDAEAKEPLYARSYPEKLVVVLGSEGAGIRPLIKRECDFLISIPMRGRIGSLNVAVAGGVFFYELLRQTGLTGA